MTILFAATVTLTIIGFLLFMGCLLGLIATEGRPLAVEENATLTAGPDDPRGGWHRYRFRGRILAGGAIEREESMSTLKGVLRQSKGVLRQSGWWRDLHWSLFLGAILGAILMTYGLFGFGTALSLQGGVPVVALLCSGSLLYATIQMIHAWRSS